MNLLYKKYPPSTIIKSHSFTIYLQDLTCAHVKIASNTTEVLVYDLMKGSCKRAKLLTLYILTHVLVSLQERITGYTLTDIRNLDNSINDTILIVLVTAADLPILGPPPPLPLGPLLL